MNEQAFLADEYSTAMRWAIGRAEEYAGAPLAVWFQGHAWDVLGRFQVVSRRDFEDHCLPTYFRQHLEVKTHSGRTLAVYASVPVQVDSNWLRLVERLADAHLGRHSLHSTKLVVEPAESSAMYAAERMYWDAIAEFSAGAGHEINNPLGAIKGQAELLLKDEIVPRRRESLQKIKEQVARIHRMIRDLHFLARQTPKHPTIVRVKDALHDAVAQVAERPIERLHLGSLEDQWHVLGQRREVARLFSELLSNAIAAAGPKGWVSVHGQREGGSLCFSIRDSGPGFLEIAQHQAFAPFFSGRSAGRGLGMGLAVARTIAERMGGRLQLTKLRPTTVQVILPLVSGTELSKAA
jgi:signal transduction histidine kinase